MENLNLESEKTAYTHLVEKQQHRSMLHYKMMNEKQQKKQKKKKKKTRPAAR